MIYESNYLMHHGIKGQKWGVENGPPYPLSLKDYTAAEKRQVKISDKLNMLKDEMAEDAKNFDKYESWKNSKNTVTFEGQMAYTKQLRKEIESLQTQVDKMPKNSKDFSKFINDTQKEIDKLVKTLDKESITDKDVLDAYAKYKKDITPANVVGNSVAGIGAVVAGGLATYGLASVGIVYPMASAGAAFAGAMPGLLLKETMKEKPEKEFDEYLDKKYNSKKK